MILHAGVRRRLLQGLILAMAGLVASLGVTFGCMIRNIVLWPQEFAHNFGHGAAAGRPELVGHIRGTSLGDIALTLVFAALTLVWLVAFTHFIREDYRSKLTWALAAGIASIFVLASWQNWLFAYPVCNPM